MECPGRIGQIVTDGIKTIPEYKDATHPNALLTPNATYTRAGRHWYDLSNARAAIGLTGDNRTLVLLTVDGTNGGHGMQVGEVADLLIRDYGVYNALNLDGGGSTTMAIEDPVTHIRRIINSPSDNPPRAEASSFAVYSDGLPPVTTASVSPEANANGWYTAPATVTLDATDLASGILDTPTGWVDQLQYSLAGAQTSDTQTVPGHTASFEISTPGDTTVTYFATDAAGNEEAAKTLTVHLVRPGDLNDDGLADCIDVAIVRAAFGTTPGGPGFNPMADVVADGIINIRDLAFVARKLPIGTKCP